MTIALGLLLGVGLLLTASPLLWPAGDRIARGETRAGRVLRERLVQAGLSDLHPAVLIVLCVLAGVASAAVIFALAPVTALALVGGLVGAVVPLLLLGWRARRRRRATRIVWPDVVDNLVSAVRAGMSLPEAIAELGRSGPTATRAAFAAADRELQATGDMGIAFDGLKARLADPVADRIVETLRMAREVGGTELTAVLRGLAGYLRQDAALRAEVEARQSWVKNAARLGVAAPWIVLLLLATRPEAVRAYDSPLGAALLVSGFLVSIVAYRIMIAVGRLPEERRWFG
ncbi:type II secretion system F family protein [Schumannella luteola]|uniref:Tight adherence protein B n=1 Tax=Schumannella luteola TaxID=472059 RepID=A0A852YE45_9MICO|nr:type II secretion system F family protein [Schumannella luteola]NYG99574.1 tight adherence protein B [Schumannella luteola]TPX01981.1 type II secretion system protein F [Schumannella luteola]